MDTQIKGYRIIDLRTKLPTSRVVYAPQRRNWARSKAEQLNQAHGAHRYYVQPIWA